MATMNGKRLKHWFMRWIWRIQQVGAIISLVLMALTYTTVLSDKVQWRFENIYLSFLITFAIIGVSILSVAYLYDVKGKFWVEQGSVFTTIRAGAPMYEEGQILSCTTPTSSFDAQVLLSVSVSLMDLSLPLLMYDTDSPGKTRAEIVRFIQGLYTSRCPDPAGTWTLYLLEKVKP